MNIEKEVRKLTREGYTPTQIVDKLKIDLKDFPVDVYREELRKIKGIKDDENEIFEEDEGDEENMKKKRSKKKDEDIEEEENKEEEEKDEENEEDEEDKENEEQEGILPYPKTIKPPEEWFEEFIKPFGVSKEFLRIYKQRIKRRKELPHPNELAADLADMKSGITNARAINYICEEYAYALDDYLKEVGENERLLRRSFGIKVSTPKPSPPPYYGYPMPQYENPYYTPNPQPYPTYPSYPHYPPYPSNNPYPPDDGNPLIKELKDLREEVKTLKLMSRGSRGDGQREYIDHLLKKIEKLEDELKERDRERIEKLERELERTRTSGIVTRDEIEEMVRRTIEEYKGRLTPEDVKRIIEEELKKLDIRLSKEDREYLIAKEKLQLEREKLQQEGKTKEMVANAIRTGLSGIGEAIARTLIEASGSERTYEVTGMQEGEIWRVKCPNCNSLITAPIGNKIITCPRCGMNYTVEIPGTSPQPLQQPQPQPQVEIQPEKQEIEEKPAPPPEQTEEKQEIEEKFVCPVCGKEFPTERKLRGHMIHHKKKKEEV